RGHGHSHGKGS
nr:Chain C, S100A9 peptide [Mus musculus]7YF3_D Chain D, S100A9 peptide [Mus musculus]